MAEYEDFDPNYFEADEEPLPDPQEEAARETLERFFEDNRESVFYSRQIEVIHEDRYFHWITNRAIRGLIVEGAIKGEVRELSTGAPIHLIWYRNNRYYRRSAKRLVEVVEKYTDPRMGEVLGLNGEGIVLAGFSRCKFILQGEDTREFAGRIWRGSGHNLDFIFERDNLVYGVEVKNTLGYMEKSELDVKLRLCHHLGVFPVFVVRMMAKTWIKEVIDNGGYAMILKYQLYPLAHGELAKEIREKLGLPVDAPRALESGTMERFLRWHERNVARA